MSNTVTQVCPYLRVSDAPEAIRFYQSVFGAVESFRLTEPSGRIGHAELQLGEGMLMISDEYPEYGIVGPQPAGTGASVQIMVSDVDEMVATAEAAGAKVTMRPADMFYGHRVAKLLDPYGHEWMLNAEKETLYPEEIQRRFAEMMSEGGGDA